MNEITYDLNHDLTNEGKREKVRKDTFCSSALAGRNSVFLLWGKSGQKLESAMHYRSGQDWKIEKPFPHFVTSVFARPSDLDLCCIIWECCLLMILIQYILPFFLVEFICHLLHMLWIKSKVHQPIDWNTFFIKKNRETKYVN